MKYLSTHYQIVQQPSEGVYKEKGSKFISYCFPINTAADVPELLTLIKSKHPKARHHCYGYRLGTEGLQFRAVDDGEPSGTAGRPILGQIDSAEITNTLIIVVRYFGGTLLGASGLIKAYKESAADAIGNNHIIQIEITQNWKICFDFSIMGKLMFSISEMKISLIEKELHAPPYLIIQTPAADADLILDQLIARTLRVHQEMITGKRIFDQLQIERL